LGRCDGRLSIKCQNNLIACLHQICFNNLARLFLIVNHEYLFHIIFHCTNTNNFEYIFYQPEICPSTGIPVWVPGSSTGYLFTLSASQVRNLSTEKPGDTGSSVLRDESSEVSGGMLNCLLISSQVTL
jgi:hypothetical protein